MKFSQVLGLNHLKHHLTSSADAGRVPHAQLFVGPEGCGTLPMAIAYAQYLLCKNTGGENEGGIADCNKKCEHLNHPDLHFAFPVATSDTVSSHPVSDHYRTAWSVFISEQPYGNLFDWYREIGIEKKQGQIGVDEAQDIVRKLSLKSYEGGYKIMIIWMVDRMNSPASNKLLKLIEEPPQNTVLLMIAEDPGQLLKTLKSRCQVLHFPPLPESVIEDGLIQKGASREEAHQIAQEANGNFNKGLDLMLQDSEDLVFEKWFAQWARSAFKAKGNKAAIHELILWSEEIAKTGRETQKKFLAYCLSLIRQAMLLNYNAESLVFLRMHDSDFDFHRFATFIHENNVREMAQEFENARYHIVRNGNSKIIFTDLSIKLTRLLHTKPSQKLPL